jgi:phosphonatase-like hydrolase
MSKYKLVIFDIAGTTVNDPGNVAGTFIQSFRDNGFDVSDEEVNLVMGFRKDEAIGIVLDRKNISYNPQLIINIHQSFVDNMIRFYRDDPYLFALPGVEETFQQLHEKGLKIALNTGFSRDITEVILSRINWKENGLINYVVCSDEVPEGRPASLMIEKIMHQLQVTDPSSVVKVGDTEVDILEGRNAKCGLVVSVTTGSYTRDQLKSFHPDHIIDDMTELPSLLK